MKSAVPFACGGLIAFSLITACGGADAPTPGKGIGPAEPTLAHEAGADPSEGAAGAIADAGSKRDAGSGLNHGPGLSCASVTDCAEGLSCALEDPGGQCIKLCAASKDSTCGDPNFVCSSEGHCYFACKTTQDCARAKEGYVCKDDVPARAGVKFCDRP
jgi:hypothetical protein